MTMLLCLRCPKVNPIVRRVLLSKIFMANPLLTITLVISFLLMMLEINSGLLELDNLAYFFSRQRKISWCGKLSDLGTYFVLVFWTNNAWIEISSIHVTFVKRHILLTKLGHF